MSMQDVAQPAVGGGAVTNMLNLVVIHPPPTHPPTRPWVVSSMLTRVDL